MNKDEWDTLTMDQKVAHWTNEYQSNGRTDLSYLTPEEKKQRRLLYGRLYHHAHKDKARAQAKQWREDNPEQFAAMNKRWRTENPEKYAEVQRRFQENHPDYNRIKSKEHYDKKVSTKEGRLAYNAEQRERRASLGQARTDYMKFYMREYRRLQKERAGIKGDRRFKLKEHQVLTIREMFADGYTLTNLAGLYNVSITAIHRIVTRKTWQHI